MKLLIFHPRLADKIADAIAGEFPNVSIQKIKETKLPLPDLSHIEVMIAANDITENMFLNMPRLQWLHLTSTGHNQVKKGNPKPDLKVTNAGSIPAVAVAEFVFMEILNDAKGFSLLLKQMESKTWKHPKADLIQNKNLTIVGTGKIGLEIAKRAKAFGMKVTGVNTTGRWVESFDQIYSAKEILKATQTADYLVLAVPEQQNTVDLISEKVLASLRPEACLINVSRSQVVNQTFLKRQLNAGNLRTAFLDTFDEEPLPTSDEFWTTKGVHITPHCAFLSPQHEIQTLKLIVQNVSKFLKNEDLLNRCFPETAD